MKKAVYRTLLLVFLMGAWLAVAQTNGVTGYYQPVPPRIAVSPISLDFRPVAVGTNADQVVTVQNAGGGLLSGMATVSAPFSIHAGKDYLLAAGQLQTVTVRYSPTAQGATNQVLSLSGGGGTNVSVTGSTPMRPAPPGNLGIVEVH